MRKNNDSGFVARRAITILVALTMGACERGTPCSQPSVVADGWPRNGQEGPIWREFFDGDAPIECIYMREQKAVSPSSLPEGRWPSPALEERRVEFTGSYRALRNAMEEVVLIPYDQPPARYIEGYKAGEARRGLVAFPDEPSPYHVILKHHTRNGGYLRLAVARDYYYPTVLVQWPDGTESLYWASEHIGRWLILALEMQEAEGRTLLIPHQPAG